MDVGYMHNNPEHSALRQEVNNTQHRTEFTYVQESNTDLFLQNPDLSFFGLPVHNS